MRKKKTSSPGLAQAQEIYHHRDRRARELKAKGEKLIGYLCCYPPLEILAAADLVPYRLLGSMTEPITEADAYLETDVCPYVRSCFDLAVKGKYDFLTGVVIPHTCEPVEALWHIWDYHLHPPYCHYINVPHQVRPPSFQFFRQELDTFRRSLDQFTGNSITDQRLAETIDLYNQHRALLRELYRLRKQEQPLISGTEIAETIIATLSIPVTEGNELLRNIIPEVKQRGGLTPKGSARLLIYGGELDDVALIQMVEECGANVVTDDLCIGTRYFWHDVEKSGDLLTGLAVRYLDKIPCPRTHRMEKPRERYKYLLDLAREFKVNGVIFYMLKYCDSSGFDIPDLRDTLRAEGIPSLYLEHDYSLATLMPLKTRIQAFVEMIS